MRLGDGFTCLHLMDLSPDFGTSAAASLQHRKSSLVYDINQIVIKQFVFKLVVIELMARNRPHIQFELIVSMHF